MAPQPMAPQPMAAQPMAAPPMKQGNGGGKQYVGNGGTDAAFAQPAAVPTAPAPLPVPQSPPKDVIPLDDAELKDF